MMLYKMLNNRLIQILVVLILFILSVLAESYLWILKKTRNTVIFPGN